MPEDKNAEDQELDAAMDKVHKITRKLLPLLEKSCDSQLGLGVGVCVEMTATLVAMMELSKPERQKLYTTLSNHIEEASNQWTAMNEAEQAKATSA